MSKLTSRATGIAAVLCSLLTAAVAPAAPYYLAWGQLYKDDALATQRPHAVALDAKGNVFVTGQADSGQGQALYTAKYDALDGHLIWEQRVTPTGTNQFIGNAIAVDSQGDCVVTGSRNVAGALDYYTIKYHGDTGAPFWAGAKTFNGGSSGQDVALKVVCDSSNDVIITGRSEGVNASMTDTGDDWVTIKYRASDGVQLGLDSYSQTTSDFDDIPAALAVDSDDDVFVAGMVRTTASQQRFYLRKLQTSNLSKAWDIIPINTGDAGGATAIAVDSNDAVVATGTFKDGSNRFGYFTVKYPTTGGDPVWQTTSPPVSAVANGTPTPGPTGVAIGPDGGPIVTGRLLNANNEWEICTIKYTSGGFFEAEDPFWDQISVDRGGGFGNTMATAIVADGASNAIIVGHTENADGNQDLYIAKYDALTGEKVFSTTFDGSETNSDDVGIGIAADKFGNIAALGDLFANKLNTGTGRHEFATFKLNRFILPAGEALPNGITGVADNAVVTVAGAPAISDGGSLAAKLSFKAGTKTGAAILVERSAAGGALLPAVKGQPVPVGPGDTAGNWVSFSDPIIAPSGDYAFAAKVSGPANKANGVWANLNGTLTRIFRQGSLIPVTGSTDRFASLVNMGLETNNLIALVKLVAPKSSNTAIIRVDQNGAGSVLLRTGQTNLDIGGALHTVTGITLFAPAPPNGGDGRWQGSTGIVARVAAVKNSDTKVKVTALVSIGNTGTPDAFFFTGKAAPAPVSAITYTSMNFPATAFGTLRFTFKAGLSDLAAAMNSALIYSPTGSDANAYALKGVKTGIPGLSDEITYGDFTDPVVNTNSLVAYIATLKGPAQQVKASTNKMIVFGNPRNAMGNPVLTRYARTGDFATDSTGNETSARWTAFTSLALPGGSANNGPIFIAKTSANKTGLWARDSNGDIRRLIMQGDKLGAQVVKKFAVLNTLSKVMTAPRSFDAAGSVAVAVTFTDNKTAILRLGIP